VTYVIDVDGVVELWNPWEHAIYVESLVAKFHFYQDPSLPEAVLDIWRKVSEEERRFELSQLDINPRFLDLFTSQLAHHHTHPIVTRVIGMDPIALTQVVVSSTFRHSSGKGTRPAPGPACRADGRTAQAMGPLLAAAALVERRRRAALASPLQVCAGAVRGERRGRDGAAVLATYMHPIQKILRGHHRSPLYRYVYRMRRAYGEVGGVERERVEIAPLCRGVRRCGQSASFNHGAA
jgi:hypothetical protein